MTRKKAILVHKFFKVSMESKARGHGFKLYKKQTETLKKRFISGEGGGPYIGQFSC